MNYDKLITDIAARSGLHSEAVRRVLHHLPDSLLQLKMGESVRTPFGAFRMTQSKGRTISLPIGNEKAVVPAKRVVKLRPGARLKVEID